MCVQPAHPPSFTTSSKEAAASGRPFMPGASTVECSWRWAILTLALALVTGSLAQRMLGAPVFNDLLVYHSRMSELFAGNLLYVSGQFEHFPLAAAPMLVAWGFGGWSSVAAFEVAFILVGGGLFVATGGLLTQIGDRLGIPKAGCWFFALSLPLAPFAVARTEPWVLFLVAMSLRSLVQESESRFAGWAALAVAAKAWPVVLGVEAWRIGWHRAAVILVGIAAAVSLILLQLPGFLSGRSFSGIHSETLVGALLLAWRAVSGLPLGLHNSAGAVYVSAPGLAILAELFIGVIAGATALRFRRPEGRRTERFRLVAVLTLAMLLASPLLSAQFILWPVLFLALVPSRAVRLAAGVIVTLTAMEFYGFAALPGSVFMWSGVVILRGLLMAGLAIGLGNKGRLGQMVTRAAS